MPSPFVTVHAYNPGQGDEPDSKAVPINFRTDAIRSIGLQLELDATMVVVEITQGSIQQLIVTEDWDELTRRVREAEAGSERLRRSR